MRTDTGEIISEIEAMRLREMMGDHIAIPMDILPSSRQLKRGKVGRNDPCPCGSGKKFKKCHLLAACEKELDNG